MELQKMSAEAIQILHLSPIPEISEMELSNVLDQLSGLSELTGELTDRNVEDILREAEELLDVTSSINISSNTSNSFTKHEESINAEKSGIQTTINTAQTIDIEPAQTEVKNNKLVSPPKEPLSARLKSPIDSTNHIKLTLDSLKEASKMIESSSQAAKEPEELISKRKPVNSKFGESNFLKKRSAIEMKHGDQSKRSNSNKETVRVNQRVSQTKLCVRLGTEKMCRTTGALSRGLQLVKHSVKDHGKAKCLEKTNKNLLLKRNSNEFKPQISARSKSKIHVERKAKTGSPTVSTNFNLKVAECKNDKPEINLQECLEMLDKELKNQVESNLNRVDLSYPVIAEKMLQQSKKSIMLLQKEVTELKSRLVKENENTKLESDLSAKYVAQQDLIHVLKEENAELFKEIEAIKGQLSRNSKSDKLIPETEELVREKENVIKNLQTELEALKSRLNAKLGEAQGITRLEEQFTLIKDKYDMQITRLELENKKLKEALDHQESIHAQPQKDKTKDFTSQTESFVLSARPLDMPKEVTGSNSARRLIPEGPLESHYTPRAVFQAANVQTDTENKIDISCQTEELRQCASSRSEKNTDALEVLDIETLAFETVSEDSKYLQRFDNKENVSAKSKRPTKSKSACDVNVDQILKQKKFASEHESQLVATLRGLRAEILFKDKENRKFKNEVEALKSQLKKLTASTAKRKTEPQRMCHIGSQTIGLGATISAEYNPVLFQVSKELEDKNDDLKSKLRILQESHDQLKEKRVKDLQILQDIHEEEIAKLVSKLDTQTALAKHLHSLLVRR